MANDYYQIKEPGEPFENRVADEKFVNPETRDVYPPPNVPGQVGTAHEQIDTLQAINALKNIGLDVGGSLEQDAPDRLLDEPMETRLLKNLFPPQWLRNPLEASQMMGEGYDEYGTASQTLPALINYLMQGGEQDPVGPQRMPFSEYKGARPGLIGGLHKNKQIEDILRKHVNSLTGTQDKKNLKTYKGR